MTQPNPKRFSQRRLAMINHAKFLGIRSGGEHRFTFVWVVVLTDRVFIRSWNGKPTGWFRAFQDEPLGTMKIADREVAIRARKARGERLMKAIESAYAENIHDAGVTQVRARLQDGSSKEGHGRNHAAIVETCAAGSLEEEPGDLDPYRPSVERCCFKNATILRHASIRARRFPSAVPPRLSAGRPDRIHSGWR